MSTSNHPFDECYLDFFRHISDTLYAFQNDLSKYVVANSISPQDAEAVTTAFLSQCIQCAISSVVQTEQGADFVSDVYKNLQIVENKEY